MFTKSQLEALEDILDAQGLEAVVEATPEQLKELRGAIHSALWAMARTIPKKDKAAIEAARKAGITQIVGRNTEPSTEVKSRLKPQAVSAKTGDELLSVLGL
jgi:predicted xylose isomerase-like sugar epimerase